MPRKPDDFAKELDAVTPALIERAKGKCEARVPGVCLGHPDGYAWVMTRHHRLTRGQGGGNTLDNLVYVCGTGTLGCHAYIHSHPTESYARGWLIRSGLNPEKVGKVAPWR